MERRRLPLAALRTESFLIEAFRSGAGERVLSEAVFKPRLRWALDAVALYFKEEMTFKEVGELLRPPTSHETARKLVSTGILAVWRHSSEPVKDAYPFDTIPTIKPKVGTSRLRRLSKTTRTIAEAATAGLSYRQIVEQPNVAVSDIAKARPVLRNGGVEVPYKYYSPEQYADLAEIASDSKRPREEYEKMAKGISRATVQNLAKTTGAFLSLFEAVRSSGYHIAPAKIAPMREILEAAGVVLRFETIIQSGENAGLVQNYYYVAKRDMELVGNALGKDSSLNKFKENPVKRIAGPEDCSLKVTTNDFGKSRDFQSLSNLLLSLKLTQSGRGPRVPYNLLLEGCNVPLFQYVEKIVYPVDSKGELEEFLERRRRELGV